MSKKEITIGDLGPAIVGGKTLSPARLNHRDVVRFLATAHGPKCAAWVVTEHRALLKKVGAFDLVLPFGKMLPRYMRFAFHALKAREHVWKVQMRTTFKGTAWRVTWRMWPGRMPANDGDPA